MDSDRKALIPDADGMDSGNRDQMNEDAKALLDALPAVENLPGPVKRRVRALKKMQLQSVNIEAEFYKKVHELECLYAHQFFDIHEKRSKIVAGELEPTDEEADFPLVSGVDAIAQALAQKAAITNGPTVQGEENTGTMETKNEDVKGIPNFWLTVFQNSEMIADTMTDQDEPILKHLTDVKLDVTQDPMGFSLTFIFSENPYFSNSALTKEYTLKCDPSEDDPFEFDGPEIVSCKGTKIDWKPGKNVTVKLIKKKQKHKKQGQTRFVTREVKNESFFNFFEPPAAPAEGSEMDIDTRDLLHTDFEIGQMFRDRIIPRAVLYFTGEAQDEDFDEDEDDEDDDFDDDEGEEDDDEVP